MYYKLRNYYKLQRNIAYQNKGKLNLKNDDNFKDAIEA